MQTDEKPHDWDRSAVYCALGRKVNESMKKVIAPVLLLCLLTVTASAAYVPEEVVSENRDGRQLVVKTYVLSPEADPGELIEEPFELEGYTYHYLETIKEEQAFKDTRAQTEVVTVETETNDLADILRQLAPTMEYSKDGFSGTLTLDHTSLQTEAKGYTTKYYTITDTKQFPGLSRNDPSYVPATTVKNGSTLTLSDISWTVTGTGLADDILVPTSYTATATYTTTGSQKVATGFVTTASYTGEVTAAGIRSVVYTVTYLGTPIEAPASFNPVWLTVPGAILLLLALGGIAYAVRFRPNAAIYAMNARGVAYKKLGKQRISTRTPKLDLTKLREYPAGDASVELPNKLAQKLAGRIITIQMYDGSRTHLVEPFEGDDNYWFAINEEEKETDNL